MAVDFCFKDRYDINDLLDIMRILRSPGGCPWDIEQDHQSIKNSLIEETYETVEAINRGSAEMLCEELGDVLLQVVFHARMEEEAGSFGFGDVCDGICKKLIVRHPHVFGDVTVADSGEVLTNWDAIKRQTKHQATTTDALRSVPREFPGLMRSAKLQKKARKDGFGAADRAEAIGDVDRACERIRQGDVSEASVGRLLFAVSGLASVEHIDPEEAITKISDRFIDDFEAYRTTK